MIPGGVNGMGWEADTKVECHRELDAAESFSPREVIDSVLLLSDDIPRYEGKTLRDDLVQA